MTDPQYHDSHPYDAQAPRRNLKDPHPLKPRLMLLPGRTRWRIAPGSKIIHPASP
uniref:hypothetical protein n=1 Tax=Rothia dentocariosa TaxID=2047 RepID=UPI003FA3BD38